MEWQRLIAVGLAAAGGAWAVWSILRPFVRQGARCGDCGGSSPPELLQVEPVPPDPLPTPHPRSNGK